MSKVYDLNDGSVFVVIGSGAGGGTLANELAQKGVDVVCLEAGNRLEMSDIVNDLNKMDTLVGWHDPREGSPTWLCKTVGGTTMRWSAVSLRFKDYEMKPLTTYGKVEGASLIDWPITYDELAPFYTRAEFKMGVSGTGDIPNSSETNNAKVLRTGGALAGYKDYSTAHIAINPEARDGRPGCEQLAFCFSGCAIGAKWSTLYTEIPKAEETNHFELRPKSMAVRVNHDKSGKVTGVVYLDKNGNQHEQKARGVAVACNVVETTRLLLNSDSNLFPKGLGNGSDQLGRNYMKHQHSGVAAIMPGDVNAHRGARQTGLIFDEWKHDISRGFVSGYTIQAMFASPGMIAGAIGGWGKDFADMISEYKKMAYSFASCEDLPELNNRITLHSVKKDGNGLPVPVLAYAQHENSKALEEHSIAAMTEIYESLGGTKITRSHGNVSTCHNMGTARMSDDPEDGVTNRWGQVHNIPNLFVSDGGLFPSSGAGNPTLTIVALAIRQAEHIASRMSQRTL